MTSNMPDEYGAEELPQPKRRTGVMIAVVGGVVAAIALPLAGFAAYNMLSGGGSQPHDVLPADAIAYARVDVDPSASQKVEALQLLDKFPAFEEATGIDDPRDDVRRAVFEAIKADTGCELDFEEDVDPWLGERFGVAVLPSSDGAEPDIAVAVQVKDEDLARTGLEELLACGSDQPDGPEGVAFHDGYAVLAETQELADGFVESAQSDPLAENSSFAADMDKLGEQGVASLWFDGEGVFDAIRSSEGAKVFGSDVAADLQNAVQSSYRSGAVAFRVDDSHGELATVVTGDAYEALDDAGTASADLPDSTAVALGLADGDRWIDQQWDSLLNLASEGQDPQQVLDQLESQLGVSLPEDLKTLLGTNFALALDGSGLSDVLTSGDPSTVRLGARVETDADEFAAVFDSLETIAAQAGVPFKFAQAEFDGGVAVASSSEYADILAEGGSLGDTAKFQEAVKDSGDAQSYVYVDMDAIEPLLMPDDAADREVLDNIEPIEALGVSSRIFDGYAEGTLRVTVD
jgi:hypothetical protein